MKALIVANWKMNPQTLKGAKLLFDSVKNGLRNIKNVEVVICPPFLYIPEIQDTKYKIQVGAQNCFWEEKGAYTGEISATMLKDLGCKYIILGHSERRRYLKETDEIINQKIKAVVKVKLNPILCIGETQEEKNQGKTPEILKEQLEKALYEISAPNLKALSFCIVYEPIWAIGTGRPCDINEAQTMGLLIRKIIAKFYSPVISEKIRVLYGGSVDSKNATGYIKEGRFQGLLVGGASLDPQEFVKIMENVSKS